MEKNSRRKTSIDRNQESEKEWPCELVLLALGFTGPEKSLPEQFGLTFDPRGNVKGEKQYQTNKPNILLPEMQEGQSNLITGPSQRAEKRLTK